MKKYEVPEMSIIELDNIPITAVSGSQSLIQGNDTSEGGDLDAWLNPANF